MTPRSRRAAVPAAAAAALALAAPVGAPAAPSAAPPAAAASRRAVSTAVGVSEREFRLALYRTRVPAGEIRFNVTNYGEDTHDLVVRDARGRELGRTPEVRPDGRAALRVRLRRGTYRLSCDVADHAALGMRATLRVLRPRGAR